ncbi:Vacuolar protein sorting-associated protein 70 [Microbotryomycetes sp. JL201]|nr:Vacuolar protein sorting-associated protein 70 [Microbotryomycetes sp. JL201]
MLPDMERAESSPEKVKGEHIEADLPSVAARGDARQARRSRSRSALLLISTIVLTSLWLVNMGSNPPWAKWRHCMGGRGRPQRINELERSHGERMTSVMGYMRAMNAHHHSEASLIDLGVGHSPKPRIVSPKEAEQTLLKLVNAESARNASHSFTWRQHIAGTENDRKSALQVKTQWEHLLGLKATKPDDHVYEAGSDESYAALTGRRRHGQAKRLGKAIRKRDPSSFRKLPNEARVWVDTYWPLLNCPVSHSLTMRSSKSNETLFEAQLVEDVLEQDPTSDKGPLTFHGFAKSGRVSGQLLYAKQGTQEDFDELRREGIDVQGKIVIVQYGGLFRGLKVRHAGLAGAAGIIIYTDPAEDGEVTIENGYKAYPDGPARQPSSVQRGSAQFLSIYPGDPTTPGEPAYKNASRSQGENLPTIPSIPISYKDAVPLLKSLNGRGHQRTGIHGRREGGLGYLGVEYFSGPSKEIVELDVQMDDTVTPIWNTYAVIPGHIEDEVVVIGNHNDAWTFGSGDPNSGTAAVYEVVRTFGQLLKTGWKPMRTILLASWDAEEYGLIGSTEFGEDYHAWLEKHVVAYLNIDVGAAGSHYDLRASPSMADLLRTVSDMVEDPARPGQSLRDRARLDKKNSTGLANVRANDLDVGALGSGSDFTVMIQRIGLASANIGFQRASKDAVYHYHSNYDSAYWMDRFGDPKFKYHEAVAKVLGLTALKMIDSVVLPLNVTAYAFELEAYAAKIPALVASLPTADQNSINLKPLFKMIKSIQSAANTLDKQTESALKELHSILKKKNEGHKRHWHDLMRVLKRIRRINQKLRQFEGTFIDERGLPQRTWYRSLIVAPGRNLGYGATTFPGLTESLTLDKNVTAAKFELDRLVHVLTRTRDLLRKD